MLSGDLGGGAVVAALEPWRAAELASYVDRHRAHFTPWLPWVATIVDAPSARAWLQGYADKLARDEGQLFGIWLGAELVGGTAFRVFDAAAGTAEIGVWVAPHAGGRGIVTRACQLMIEWAFRARGLHRVEWRAVPTNGPSLALAARLGMRREGVLRSAMPAAGQRRDLEIWAITRP